MIINNTSDKAVKWSAQATMGFLSAGTIPPNSWQQQELLSTTGWFELNLGGQTISTCHNQDLVTYDGEQLRITKQSEN